MKHPPLMPSPTHARGFTLVEMLLVVAIIGILVTMLAPRLQMLGTPRVTAAARVLTQLTRYARTMALLHQAETVLSVSPDGLIRVGAGGAGTDADFQSEASGGQAGAPQASLALSAAGGAGAEGGSLFMAEGVETEPDGVTSALAPSREPPGFANEVDTERRVENVTIAFLGYTDSLDDPQARSDATDSPEKGSVVRFRSNGTCRPHRYKLTDETGVEVRVAIDMLGMARVETGEGER